MSELAYARDEGEANVALLLLDVGVESLQYVNDGATTLFILYVAKDGLSELDENEIGICSDAEAASGCDDDAVAHRCQ